jgi:hypothetical protein
MTASGGDNKSAAEIFTAWRLMATPAAGWKPRPDQTAFL